MFIADEETDLRLTKEGKAAALRFINGDFVTAFRAEQKAKQAEQVNAYRQQLDMQRGIKLMRLAKRNEARAQQQREANYMQQFKRA